MKLKNVFRSYYMPKETNILKDIIYIGTVKANNKKKHFYGYNLIDGYKYTIIIKAKKRNHSSNDIKLIIATVDHPYIIKLIYYSENVSTFVSVFEFFTETTLYSSIIFRIQYDEPKIKSIIYQIILTVYHLHSNNLAHKKLSPHSFLIKSIKNELMIKLRDIFKITTITQKTNPYIKGLNVFQIGIIMYFLACGEFPPVYNQYNAKSILFQKRSWERFSIRGKNFIQKILLSDVRSMITIKEALEHDWFKEDIKPNIYINFDILKSIYEFWKKNTFKRYILNTLAKYIMKEDVYWYNYIFLYLNTMKDGSITYDEYFITMKKLGLLDASIEDSFNGLDISKNGRIKYSNIVACLLNNFIKINKNLVYSFFKKVDYNNEGVITKKKLCYFYNLKMKKDVSSADKRKFTFEEFYNYLCKE